MYKVVAKFVDLQDENHVYEVGDEFPRLGYEPSLARITELSTENNKRGIVLIESVEDEPVAEDDAVEEEKPAKTAKKAPAKGKKSK